MNGTLSAPTAIERPKAVKVSVTNDTLTVDLDDGRTIAVPIGWYPLLAHGAPAERTNLQIVGAGYGIHWPVLDEDLGVDGIVLGRWSTESASSFERWRNRREKPRTQPSRLHHSFSTDGRGPSRDAVAGAGSRGAPLSIGLTSAWTTARTIAVPIGWHPRDSGVHTAVRTRDAKSCLPGCGQFGRALTPSQQALQLCNTGARLGLLGDLKAERPPQQRHSFTAALLLGEPTAEIDERGRKLRID